MTAVIQQVTLFLSFVVILAYIYRVVLNRSAFLYSIPVIVLMAHFCVFFIVKHCMNPLDINTWSSAIRLQTTLTFLAYGIYNIYRDRGHKWTRD